MSKCLCPACTPEPAPTWTPDYRLACEARHLLNLPLAERRKALAAQARAARRQALEAEMLRQWGAGRKTA